MEIGERAHIDSPAPSIAPFAEDQTALQQPGGASLRPSLVGNGNNIDPNDVTIEDENDHGAKSERHEVQSTRIRRSISPLLFVMGYSALALFAWITTCILVSRPLGQHSDRDGRRAGYQDLNPITYAKTEKWFQAARVAQSIVSVLTIPLASSVCSKAAVTFAQHPRKGSSLTMRQTMVLADRGWTAPGLWWASVRSPKRHGSAMLWFGMALVLFGSAMSPLQEIFLSRAIIHAPARDDRRNIQDISDQFQYPETAFGVDNNLIAVLTRSVLASSSLLDVQARLWSHRAPCDAVTGPESVRCLYDSQSKLANLALYDDPFLSELSSNFSTGRLRQYAPRFNSSSRVDALELSGLPKSCNAESGAFFARYSSEEPDQWRSPSSSSPYWTITACVPGNSSHSPWQNTRSRQDFSEELFVNISYHNRFRGENFEVAYKVTLDTTAGYFELPNIKNEYRPGPLLAHGPPKSDQMSFTPIVKRVSIGEDTPDPYDDLVVNGSFNSSFSFGNVTNKGPLLSIALALFGDGSYLATRVTHPHAYIYPAPWGSEHYTASLNCVDLVPIVKLFDTSADYQIGADVTVDPCLTRARSVAELSWQLSIFVANFIPHYHRGNRFTNGWNAAAFLANEKWLLNNPNSGGPTRDVTNDPGFAITKPAIPASGMILISALLGVFLLACYALAIYTWWSPRWTDELDSFAMMRIGAAIADQLPLYIARDTRKLTVLEETPGWIGDGTPRENIGHLELGAQTRLDRSRKYRCYSGDDQYLPGNVAKSGVYTCSKKSRYK